MSTKTPELNAAIVSLIKASTEVERAAIEWIRDGAPDDVEDAVAYLGGSLDELACQLRTVTGRV